MTRLPRTFFERDTVAVARDLLGNVLVHEHAEGRVAGRIVETEAYMGWDDLASHGHRRVTKRNKVMFGPAGFSFVYLTYGIHWLCNVVAKPPDVDYAAAVLIRALEPLEGLQHMALRRANRTQQEWTSGPGRLTVAMGIGPELNERDMTLPDSQLYFVEGDVIQEEHVRRGPRVGINVAEPWLSIPWRFRVADNPYVSRKR